MLADTFITPLGRSIWGKAYESSIFSGAGVFASVLAALLAAHIVQRIDDFQLGFVRVREVKSNRTDWIDPRAWASLVRAYALFLTLATANEYNKIVTEIAGPWIVSAGETAKAGIGEGSTRIGLFLLPFLFSQLATAFWLLLRVQPHQASSDNRDAVLLATDVLRSSGVPASGYRGPKILVGRVAQPALVSLAGRPLLLLPRRGLAYFRHYLEERGDGAFQAAICHELGHLASWDDLFFVPWLCYITAGLIGCGVLGLSQGQILQPVVSHVFMLAALLIFSLYVIRRREAYADSYSVLMIGAVHPCQAAISAIRRSPAQVVSWLGTHFNASRRLSLLNSRGRALIQISGIDLVLIACMYFNLSIDPLSLVKPVGAMGAALTTLLQQLGQLSLEFLMLLMISGCAVVNEGKIPRRRYLAGAALFCLSVMGVFDLLWAHEFSSLFTGVISIGWSVKVVFGTASFVLVFRLMFRWAVEQIRPLQKSGAVSVVRSVTLVVGTFAALQALVRVGMILALSSWAAHDWTEIRTLEERFRHVDRDDWRAMFSLIAPLLPILIPIGIYLVLPLVFASSLAIWTRLRSRLRVEIVCPECSRVNGAALLDKPLTQLCVYCEAIIRRDLVVRISGEVT